MSALQAFISYVYHGIHVFLLTPSHCLGFVLIHSDRNIFKLYDTSRKGENKYMNGYEYQLKMRNGNEITTKTKNQIPKMLLKIKKLPKYQ